MTDRLKADARSIFESAIDAVRAGPALRRACVLHDDRLVVGNETIDLRGVARVIVVGAGKAVAPMAVALETVLGDRITDGLVVTRHGHAEPTRTIRVLEAGHPVPDQAGLVAVQAMASLLEGTTKDDLVIGCFTGGASALLPAPRPPLSLDDEQATTRLLLSAGCDIHAINTLRRHLSRVKGGGLLRLARPSRVVNLLISDVIGDEPAAIGSGPMVPDPTSFADAWRVINDFELESRLPEPVRELLIRGRAGEEPETLKPSDLGAQVVSTHVIASNAHALDAAVDQAQFLGYLVVREDVPLTGEAAPAGRRFTRRARDLRRSNPGVPVCLLAGGETTVTFNGPVGMGGRAQEFALSAAFAMPDREELVVLAAGTDGSDGNTDATGALTRPNTVTLARERGFSAVEQLEHHDAYPVFAALDDLIKTGPTGTNVMDIYLAVFRPGNRRGFTTKRQAIPNHPPGGEHLSDG